MKYFFSKCDQIRSFCLVTRIFYGMQYHLVFLKCAIFVQCNRSQSYRSIMRKFLARMRLRDGKLTIALSVALKLSLLLSTRFLSICLLLRLSFWVEIIDCLALIFTLNEPIYPVAFHIETSH